MSGGFSRYLRVWRTHDLALLHTYPPCDGSIRALAISTDQRYRVYVFFSLVQCQINLFFALLNLESYDVLLTYEYVAAKIGQERRKATVAYASRIDLIGTFSYIKRTEIRRDRWLTPFIT